MSTSEQRGLSPRTDFLARPEGRIAYDVQGEGPLVVCIPGMGDLRSTFRFVVPRLVEAGYRVATMDLRGHGGSDTTFSTYDDVAAGQDALALVEHLGGRDAVLVGNSMGAGAAVWAAAERPDLVAGLALVGPFVRDLPMSAVQRLMLAVALRRPWGPAAWGAYVRTLYPTAPPADLPTHLSAIRASLRRPGGWAAFKATTGTTHAPAEERLDRVRVPALVVMGTKDPDFPDPAAEARAVAGALGALGGPGGGGGDAAEVLLVEGAGHYPQAEMPDVVAPALLTFLARTTARA